MLLMVNTLIYAHSQVTVNQVKIDDSCSNINRDLQARVKYLEKMVTTLQTNLATIGAQLTDIINNGGLSPNVTATTTEIQRQRLALGLLQLGIIILTDKPFAREFRLVQQLGVKEARLRIAFDNLAAHASTGVATTAQLRDGFGLILLPKLTALVEEEQVSWGRQTWRWFVATAVPIWQTSEQPVAKELTNKIIVSTMNYLSEDDLPGAVNMLVQLDGPAARLTTRWLAEARARIKLNAAYEIITSTILVLLSNTN
ncbi:hypothetical protein TI03_03265 [Achromatium sp. WMS1]|nr:hypothetical protein TI03_03265 [Achromatium sp. WMS1]